MPDFLVVLCFFLVLALGVVSVWALVQIRALQKQCAWLTQQYREISRWRSQLPRPAQTPATPATAPISEKDAARERLVHLAPAVPAYAVPIPISQPIRPTAVPPATPHLAPAVTPPSPPAVPAPLPPTLRPPAATPPVTPPSAPVIPAAQPTPLSRPPAVPITPAVTAPMPSAHPPVRPPIVPPPPPSPQPPAPRRRIGLEELLSTRILVWVAGIAAALAGVYFVQATIQRGLISPNVRVLMATGFGLAMLGLGQWRRRLNPTIAQAVSAAGVADLFACIVACNYFHLLGISGPLAFAFMAAITALAVVLSLQQGPFVAALGLIGGFLTPALVKAGVHENAGSLFGYLFLLQLGLLAITRIRGWSILAACTVLGSTVWVAFWLLVIHPFYDPVWAPALQGEAHLLGLFVLGAVAATILTTATDQAENTWAGKHLAAHLLTWGATLIGLVFVSVLLGISGFSNMEWAFVGLLVAGCLTLGRLRAPYEGLAWVASALVLGLLVTGVLRATDPIDLHHWGLLMAIFGLLMAGGTYAASWGAPVPVRWIAASAVSSLGYMTLAYLTLGTSPRSPAWAALAGGVALAYALAAIPAERRRSVVRSGEATLMVLLSTTAVALILAVPMALDHAWLTAVWSLLIPVLMYASLRLNVPALRFFSILAAALAAARLLAAPALDPAATGLYFSWWSILIGYGIPLLSFAATAYLLRHTKNALASFFESAPLALALAFTSLLVRRYFHQDSLLAPSVQFWEAGTYSILWLILGWSFTAAGQRHQRPLLLAGGHAILTSAFVLTALAQVAILYPPWAGALGPYPIFNSLLYVYGAPILILAILAIDLQRRADHAYAQTASSLSQILLALLMAMEIRHFFHRPTLLDLHLAFVEMGTYSIGTLVLGWTLCSLARRFPTLVPRPLGQPIVAVGTGLALLAQLLILYPGWTADIGTSLIFNPMLYVYGLPLLLILLISMDFQRYGATNLIGFLNTAGLALLFAFFSVEIRHGFHRSDPDGVLAPALNFLEIGTYTITWLLLGCGLFKLGERLTRPTLLGGGRVIFAIALGQAVLAQLLFLLPDLSVTVHPWPIFNELLYVYAIPVTLILLAAWYLSQKNDRGMLYATTLSLGLGLLAALLTLEVHHFHHLADLRALSFSFAELGSHPILWLTLGWLIAHLGQRWQQRILTVAGRILLTAGLAAPLLLQTLVVNPRAYPWNVGTTPIFNALLWVYGLPALLATLLSIDSTRQRRLPWARLAGGAALVLVFTLITLEVRQAFQGPVLNGSQAISAELLSYDVAWFVLAFALVSAGIPLRSAMLRWASLLLMIITVGKVFIVDAAAAKLTTDMRVLALVGLAATLLSMAYLYQRFVFTRAKAIPPAPSPGDLPTPPEQPNGPRQ